MAFVRASHYRHVFSNQARKEQLQEGFLATNCAFEGSFIAANGKFVAFCTRGSGCFTVLKHDQKGRLPSGFPKIDAHQNYVLDLQWNPYDDNMIASCSEDGSIKIWNIPEFGLITNTQESLMCLDHHQKRCVQLAWHPAANNILMSVSQDPEVVVWNLDQGESVKIIDCFPDIVWNAAWSSKGDKIVTSCKDKKFRIHNARTGELLIEGEGHQSPKPQRVIFTMEDKYLFSTGFSKMSERQYAVWNANTMEELNLGEVDTANGTLIPYYDSDREMVYLAAKGDSTIRYYELDDEEPYVHYLSTFSSKSVQRCVAPIPRRDVVVNEHEVMRFYKLVQRGNDGIIEPVSFTVPRKSELFQNDIYPDAVSHEAALEADEWESGMDAEPKRVDMSTKFVGKVATKNTGGGGLKKGGGLKGLKAKKEAKADAVNDEEKPQPSATPEAPTKVKTEEEKGSSPTGSTESSVIENLQAEINALKESEAKHAEEMKLLVEKNEKQEVEISEMMKKLEENVQVLADIKVAMESRIESSDKRITDLENLANEEEEE